MANTQNNVMNVRQILVDQIKVAQEEVDRLMGRLANFDEMFNIDTEGDNPHPILAATPKSAPKVAETSAETPARTSAPKKRTKAGAQPPIHDRMVSVMGSDELNASQIFERLEAADALPASNNPKQYISFILSKEKNKFESVRRGVYRVKNADRAAAAGDDTTDVDTEESTDSAEQEALIAESSDENVQADATI